jgi:cytochrome c oxidase subunit IV
LKSWYPPRILLLAWLSLLTLLGATVLGAYQPLGAFNIGLALAIALGKALIVAAIFMELRDSNGIRLVAASAGFFWLAIMLWLALADYVTRPKFQGAISAISRTPAPTPAAREIGQSK